MREVGKLEEQACTAYSDSWLQNRVSSDGGFLRSREANYTSFGFGNEDLLSEVILFVDASRCWGRNNLRFDICGRKLLQKVSALVNIIT